MSDKNPHFGATFAERKALREAPESEVVETEDKKAVQSAENKAVAPTATRRKKS